MVIPSHFIAVEPRSIPGSGVCQDSGCLSKVDGVAVAAEEIRCVFDDNSKISFFKSS